MSSANSTATTNEESADTATSGFYTAVGIGAAVGICLILVFSYLRTRIPDVFELRALLNTWKSYNDYNDNRVGVIEPRPSNTFFGWVGPVFNTSEDEVVKKIGLDAAMFIRFIRTSFYITSFLALFGLILIMPVYGTGKNHLNDEKISGLRLVSVSNVEPSSGRFWMTVVTEFVTAAIVIIMASYDFQHFSKLRRSYRTKENPVNYSIIVYDIPKEARSESDIRDRFECIVPGQVASVVLIKDPSEAMKLQKKLDKAINKRETAEYLLSVKGEEPKFKPGPLGALNCFIPKVDAISYWSREQEQLADAIHDQESIAEPTPSAIVVLTNKKAASILVQANSRISATKWLIDRAPEPKGLHWGGFKVPGYQAEVRTIIISLFMLIFTIFWTIPATAIVGLASLKNLTDIAAFKWAKGILDLSPYLVGLIEGLLPPLVMAVLIGLIPALFRFVLGFERSSSVGTIEMKTRDFFYMFTLYGTFFVYLIGASFFQDIDKLQDEWANLISILADAIPGTGIYFATFIILKSLIPFPLAMSGVVRCIIRWFLLKFLSKTERQKRNARSSGGEFQYFRQYGFGMLTLFLSLAFSSLAPLVPLAGAIYFGLGYVCFRYIILFSSYSECDYGGQLFSGTFWGTMIGLILKQIVVISVLGLKKAPTPAALCFIPLVITLCFTMIISKRYENISKHGSLLDFYEEGKKLDEVPSKYKSIYEQPAGKVTNYENLNGVVEIKDVYSEVELDNIETEKVQTVRPETFDNNVGYVPDPAADREEV